MTDIIYDIAFHNVTSLNGSDLVDTNGTIEVDYSTGTIESISGTWGYGLNVTGDYTGSFTTFSPNLVSLTNTSASSTDAAGDQLQFFIPQISGAVSNPTATVTFLPFGTSISYSGSGTIAATEVCYASGTLIRTPHGDVRVELLNEGDAILTAAGEPRAVKWVGRRKLRRDFARQINYETVRIAAHAFGPDRPSQDLVVSPGHSIGVDLAGEGEVLIMAKDLVNGATVTREWVDQVTWHHVELDSHDILLASNLPAESYLAMGNRGFFHVDGPVVELFAEEGRDLTHADFCRPVIEDPALLARARERLVARARSLGFTPDSDDDLRIVVDGEASAPLSGHAAAAFFRIPAGARDVQLVSSTFVPLDFGLRDGRTLGSQLLGLVFVGDDGDTVKVGMDDPRLGEGLHAVEFDGTMTARWTDGALALDPALWKDLTGDVFLLVPRRVHAVRRWVAPQARDAALPARPALRVVG